MLEKVPNLNINHLLHVDFKSRNFNSLFSLYLFQMTLSFTSQVDSDMKYTRDDD